MTSATRWQGTGALIPAGSVYESIFLKTELPHLRGPEKRSGIDPACPALLRFFPPCPSTVNSRQTLVNSAKTVNHCQLLTANYAAPI